MTPGDAMTAAMTPGGAVVHCQPRSAAAVLSAMTCVKG